MYRTLCFCVYCRCWAHVAYPWVILSLQGYWVSAKYIGLYLSADKGSSRDVLKLMLWFHLLAWMRMSQILTYFVSAKYIRLYMSADKGSSREVPKLVLWFHLLLCMRICQIMTFLVSAKYTQLLYFSANIGSCREVLKLVLWFHLFLCMRMRQILNFLVSDCPFQMSSQYRGFLILFMLCILSSIHSCFRINSQKMNMLYFWSHFCVRCLTTIELSRQCLRPGEKVYGM